MHHKFAPGPRYYQQKSYSFGIFMTPNLSCVERLTEGQNSQLKPKIFVCDFKSNNLEYKMLVHWDDGKNDSSTRQFAS